MQLADVLMYIHGQEPALYHHDVKPDNVFVFSDHRQRAVPVLLDFGISCVIAPSFADIFCNNCFKNGILPVILPQEQVDKLMEQAGSDKPELEVDLEGQTVSIPGTNHSFSFEVDLFRKKCLLEGLDDIAITLGKIDKIDSFEADDSKVRPWLYERKAS